MMKMISRVAGRRIRARVARATKVALQTGRDCIEAGVILGVVSGAAVGAAVWCLYDVSPMLWWPRVVLSLLLGATGGQFLGALLGGLFGTIGGLFASGVVLGSEMLSTDGAPDTKVAASGRTAEVVPAEPSYARGDEAVPVGR
jgi:hypothetical protein